MGIEGILTLVFTPVVLFLLYLVELTEPASKRCNRCQTMVGYDFCTLCEGEGKCGHQTTTFVFIVPIAISAVRCLECRGRIKGGRKVITIFRRKRHRVGSTT